MCFLEHARREFAILKDCKDYNIYGPLVEESVMALMKVFQSQGHTGESYPLISRIFYELANRKLLSPLTGAEDEWFKNYLGVDLWNTRLPGVVKHFNGICTYSDAIRWKTPKGISYTGKTRCGLSHIQQIKSFPFIPHTFYIDVIEHEIRPDYWEFEVKDPAQLEEVWKLYDRIPDPRGGFNLGI